MNHEPEPTPGFQAEQVPTFETDVPNEEASQHTAPVSDEAELPDAAPGAENAGNIEVTAGDPVA